MGGVRLSRGVPCPTPSTEAAHVRAGLRWWCEPDGEVLTMETLDPLLLATLPLVILRVL